VSEGEILVLVFHFFDWTNQIGRIRQVGLIGHICPIGQIRPILILPQKSSD